MLGMLGFWINQNRQNEANRSFGIAGLLRHWRLVSLCGASALMLGVLFASSKPITYTASTQLLLYNRELQPGNEPIVTPGRGDTPLLENAIEIFKSRTVLSKVVGTLNLGQDPEFLSDTLWEYAMDWVVGPPIGILDENERALEHMKSKIAVERVGLSHTILVKYTSLDPNKAAVIANEIARSASQIRTNTDSGSPTKASLVRERLQGLGPSAYVISTADPPGHPDGPRRLVVALAAAIVGLGIGTTLAFLLDFTDRTFRTATQVKNALGLECFGAIPCLQQTYKSRRKPPTTEDGFFERHGEFRSLTAETTDPALYQALTRARVVLCSTLALRTIGVTSTIPGEGATTVAAMLASLLAKSGRAVLIVDGVRSNRSLSQAAAWNALPPSMRSPQSAALLGTGAARDTGTGVDILTIAEPIVMDTDAVWWTRVHEILCEAENCYDRVIVDLPALTSGPDVQIAAQKLDGLLLVLQWGGCGTELVQRALELSGGARSKFAGAILNMADRRLIGSYGDKLTAVEIAPAARRFAIHTPRS
jgi:polysaccharide biosynthesis transport protein